VALSLASSLAGRPFLAPLGIRVAGWPLLFLLLLLRACWCVTQILRSHLASRCRPTTGTSTAHSPPAPHLCSRRLRASLSSHRHTEGGLMMTTAMASHSSRLRQARVLNNNQQPTTNNDNYNYSKNNNHQLLLGRPVMRPGGQHPLATGQASGGVFVDAGGWLAGWLGGSQPAG